MATLAATLPFVLGGDPPTTSPTVPVPPVPAVPLGINLTEAIASVVDLPRDLSVQNQGDLYFPNGDVLHVFGIEAIGQQLELAFAYWKGEWFASLDSGFDFYGLVLVENPDLEAIRTEATTTALSVPGVTSIETLELDLDRQSRTLTLEIEVNSDLGLVRRSIVLAPPSPSGVQ